MPGAPLGGVSSTQRPGASRLDAYPPAGGMPGSDPEFAREQLLDEYGIALAVLSTLDCVGSGNASVDYEADIPRAVNDFNLDRWLESDPRWLASISVPFEDPQAAVKEIERCRSASHRYVQIMVGSRTERPQGNPNYWPIYEAAEHYGLPVAFHVAPTKLHTSTGLGAATFYYELHVSFPFPAQAMVPSLVFGGTFDRFPGPEDRPLPRWDGNGPYRSRGEWIRRGASCATRCRTFSASRGSTLRRTFGSQRSRSSNPRTERTFSSYTCNSSGPVSART